MPSTIDSYRNLIEQPFGRIFYDIVYSQLNVTGGSKRILDFGAGFCVTANHYASEHEVVAYEPNQEMINRMIPSNPFTLITDEWYENMLLLEQKCADMDEFKSIAFFNHLKFIK